MHKPPKVYTFRFILGNIIPKSVKCIHSPTKDCNTPRGLKVAYSSTGFADYLAEAFLRSCG